MMPLRVRYPTVLLFQQTEAKGSAYALKASVHRPCMTRKKTPHELSQPSLTFTISHPFPMRSFGQEQDQFILHWAYSVYVHH